MEQRRFERFSVNLPVAFSKAFTGDLSFKEGKTRNISMGGCMVEQAELPIHGTYLYVRTYVSEKPACIKVELAKVRWVQEDTFGVEFIQIQPDQADQLRHYIGSINPE